MGVFFKSAPMRVATSLEEAYKVDPATVSDPRRAAADKAKEISRAPAGQFSWGRLVIAIVLLLALFFAATYTAQNDKLLDLYKLLLHSFELVLGAVIGLIMGEAISRR